MMFPVSHNRVKSWSRQELFGLLRLFRVVASGLAFLVLRVSFVVPFSSFAARTSDSEKDSV